MFGKQRAAAVVAEFLGTAVLTLLIFSVQRSTIGVPFFVALAAGLAVVIMKFAFDAVSGGFFNPALTLGLWTARKLSTVSTVVFILAQFAGAYVAYLLYKYFTKGTLQNVGGQFTARIMVAELVGTGIFAFGFAASLYQRFSAATSATIGGLSLTLGMIAASSASIAILNPAVALGIKAWVLGTYVLGPVLGALIGVNLYTLLFAPEEVVVAEATVAEAKATKPVVVKKTAVAPKRAAAKKPAAKTTVKKTTTTRTRVKK